MRKRKPGRPKGSRNQINLTKVPYKFIPFEKAVTGLDEAITLIKNSASMKEKLDRIKAILES